MKPVNVVRVTVSLYVSLHPMFTKSDKKWQKDPILTQADLSSQCKLCFLIAQGRQNKKRHKEDKTDITTKRIKTSNKRKNMKMIS